MLFDEFEVRRVFERIENKKGSGFPFSVAERCSLFDIKYGMKYKIFFSPIEEVNYLKDKVSVFIMPLHIFLIYFIRNFLS